MSDYIVRPKAKREFQKQAKFISRDGMSRADAFLDHIIDTFELLAKNPSIGRSAERFGKGLYVWPDTKYKTYIYYTPHQGYIIIERVIGMRKSQPKAFKKY